MRLTIASEHCWYSPVPLSLIPHHASLLPLSPFYWCFPASSSLPPMVDNPPPSLTAVVDRQYLLYELLFLPGELLLEREAAKCQSMLEACVEGSRWSLTEKWDMQCMVLGWGDEWDFLCRSHRLGKRGSWTGGGCRTKRVCSEMSPLIVVMHVYICPAFFSGRALSNNLWVIDVEIWESPLPLKTELLSLYTVVHVSSQLL